MKKVILFLLIAASFYTVKAQQTDLFKDTEWLKNHRVQSVKEWFFIPKEGTLEPSEYVFVTGYREYDSTGILHLENEYKEGEFLYASHYTYNKRGDKDEVKRIAENDSFLSKDVYVYDYASNGNINELVKNDTITIKFKYDKKASEEHPVEAAVYKKGKMVGKDLFYYNEAGLVTKMEKYVGGERLFYTKEYTYNDSNQVIAEVMYNPSKSFFTKKTFIYNKSGFLNVEVKYDANGKVQNRIVYTLDLVGKPMQGMYYNADGILTGIIRYEYKLYK